MKLSEAEYRALVDHSPVLIWRAGLDAKCDYFNETWLAFTGRPLEAELGDGWATGVHEDDLERCVAYYREHFDRREAFEMEYRLRRHDGEYRWIVDRGAPYFDEAGTFAGFIGSCVDVDERRRGEAAREVRDGRALAAAHDFEHWILGIVGHDIRNPLAAISVAQEILLVKADDPRRVRDNAERIGRAVTRIEHLVNELLDLTRERRGGIPLTMTEVDLSDVYRQVVEEVRAVEPSRTIGFSATGVTAAFCDPHRTAQAASNLVSNAVQHSLPDSPVTTSLVADDRALVFAVHNEGYIAADDQPKLFTAFESNKTGRRRSGGLGLGLYIANAIARAHGGTISVSSDPDAGTTFTLTLPRRSSSVIRA